MADDGILLEGRNGGIRHAGEVVVGGVVLAHVLEAEPPVLPFPIPPFRRAIFSRGLAGGMLAHGTLGLLRLVAGGLDPDAVEKRRVEIHDSAIMSGLRP